MNSADDAAGADYIIIMCSSLWLTKLVLSTSHHNGQYGIRHFLHEEISQCNTGLPAFH